MTNTVSPGSGSSGSLYQAASDLRNGSEAAFNEAIRQALNVPRGASGRYGSQGFAPTTGTGQQDAGTQEGTGTMQLEGADLLTAAAGQGMPLVSTETQELIDEAIQYDREHDPRSGESTRRWNAVQNAIADELRGMIPRQCTTAEYQPVSLQLTPDQQQQVEGLNVLALGSDPLARQARAAIELVDTEIRMEERDHLLHSTIAGVEGSFDAVEDKNDDRSWFRKRWGDLTGGEAGDDFEDYLKGRLDQLNALDQRDETLSDAEYVQELQNMMGDFEAQFQSHVEKVADSDETWNTVGEVGRVVAAATVGIATTAFAGPVAGFGAALGTYELIDVAGDVYAGAQGKDPYADGHVGILTGIADAAGIDGQFGMTREHLKTWALDNSLDVISSVGVGGATFAGMRTAGTVAPRLAALNGGNWFTSGVSSQLGTRIVSTTAGGVAAQGVNGTASLASDATRLGFEGELGTDEGNALLGNSLKTQGLYLATSAPTAAAAGWIPLYRAMPAGTSAAGATSNATSRLSYPGLMGQFANDTVSNVGTEYVNAHWLMDRELSKADAIGALGSVLPGTVQNVTVRPDTQQHINERDVRLTSWTGFPPERIRLQPITAAVVAFRGLMQGGDAATGLNMTRDANNQAVTLATVRSSLSKLAWFRGNHRLIDVYDRALQGDPEALNLFDEVVSHRGRHGIKMKEGDEDTSFIAARRSEIEALVAVGEAYANARARLPADQQASLPGLSVRNLTDPAAFLARLQEDTSIPQDVRDILQQFDPDVPQLRYSNIVEGLLTDPEFLVNGIEALGVRLQPSDVDALRQIFNTQKLLEADIAQGGYSDLQPGVRWNELSWRPSQEEGATRPGVFDEETSRLNAYVESFLSIRDTESQASNNQLNGLVEAWQDYVSLYSHAKSWRYTNAVVPARAAYEGARNNLPQQLRDLLPESRGMLPETPQAVLTRLRQDQNLPPGLRNALADFNPNIHLLENSGVVQQLLADPQLLTHRLEQLRSDGRLSDAEFDSIHVIIDVYNRLKADVANGGYNDFRQTTPVQQRTPWNELGWRPLQEPGQQPRPGVYDEEVGRLDDFVQEFLSDRATDSEGNVHPEVNNLLDTWRAYMALYSQTQYELAAADYEPGISHRLAEQKLGSSAAPDTRYGYILKAGAYGVAVNLVYSWMVRPRPATDGFVQGALTTAYVGEAALASYNLWGQIGYMRALGDMTAFRAKYSQAQYTPSDDPSAMAVFDPALHQQFKQLEARRRRWNFVADLGSGISAVRNTAMGLAFSSLGLPTVAGMYYTNAGLSLGWLAAQRVSHLPGWVQRPFTPRVKGVLRWASIIGGPLLQVAAVTQAYAMAEEIADKRGHEADSLAAIAVGKLEEWLSKIIDGLIDEDIDVTDLNESENPLPDRA